VQKLGVVIEYLAAVDTTADGSNASVNLVREVTEEVEEYRSCGSDTPNPLSSSSSSSSLSDDNGWDNDDNGWENYI